jgi:hypothetical protein
MPGVMLKAAWAEVAAIDVAMATIQAAHLEGRYIEISLCLSCWAAA